MKQFIVIVMALSLFGGLMTGQTKTPDSEKKKSSKVLTPQAGKKNMKVPTTENEKISYSIGAASGKNLQMQNINLDKAMFLRGLKDQLDGAELALTEREIDSVLQKFQSEMMAKAEEKHKAAADKNKKEGEAFLAANKEKPGVITLPSGLQYKVITMGTGPKPAATNTVKVHYRGTLIDGTEFDSSYKRNAPIQFPLNQVIKGWTEGLQLMPTGSKFEFYIPSNLAYGERGSGGAIGPDATLIFEVELISFE